MSPYKIPCGTILEHFLRQNTLYESAVSGHLYFYSTPFFHAFSSRLFFHRDRSKIGPRESGLPPRIPFGRIAQIRETNRFCLHLFLNTRMLEGNSGENLPFSFCFFTIREY